MPTPRRKGADHDRGKRIPNRVVRTAALQRRAAGAVAAKRAAERLRAADLRKDFEQQVESEVARRVGQLVGQRFADVVSGLSPIEYLCLIRSMLNDLHREGRLKI